MKTKLAFVLGTLLLGLNCCSVVIGQRSSNLCLEGRVELGGQPVSQAEITLWSTQGNEAPRRRARTTSNRDGLFVLRTSSRTNTGVFYLTASGSVDSAGKTSGRPAVMLLSILGSRVPDRVVVNELTTVASAFTAARFIDGDAISGNLPGLRIAAGNAPNLVDPVTGKWGQAVLDPINSTQNTTLARLNTLACLITAYGTVSDETWRSDFFKAATATAGKVPANTLQAMAGIAKTPWANPKKLFTLFDKAYPQPKEGRRGAPLLPYLAYAPSDWAMILKFAGGGTYSAGKLCPDANGNIWSGQNWMPGSQSGVINNIGGGTVKLAPNGTALSPPITGFTGMGVDGMGWGTGVSLDKVWVTSFNGAIGVMDFNGRQLGKESDFPMAGKTGGLMGVGVARQGDVWIADGTKNQLLHFPGGRVKDGKTVSVDGLKSPFGIAIDSENHVWVSNSQSDTVIRFPANDPTQAKSFRVGIGARGVALDSKGNLWVASNTSLDFPPNKVPDGTPIIKQFEMGLQHLKDKLVDGRTTGVLNMIRPDGTQPAPKGFDGNKVINVPWGVSIDGNDDVWFANFWGRGVGLMAGAEPNGHANGTKTGDLIHMFQSGSLEMITDAVVDPAGNVWAANNWNFIDALASEDPARPTSTWGGGDGIVVIYGVAAPTRTPVMGHARPAN